MLRGAASELADVIPKGLDIDAFANGCSEGDFEEARKRLRQCSKCPPHGGACDTNDLSLIERGERPHWDPDRKPHPGLVWPVCDRWPEHLLRKKLIRADVGEPMLGCRFETFRPRNTEQESALRMCEAYVATYPSIRNLLLYGDVGLGKTHLCIAVLAALFRAGKARTGMLAHTGEFFQLLRRDTGSEELLARAMHVDVLIFDDVGKQRTTDWVREQTDIVINKRWLDGRSTLFTANTDAAQIEDAFGRAALSRIESNMAERVIAGHDYRTSI